MKTLAIEQSSENPFQLTIAGSKTTRLLKDAELEELTQITSAYHRVIAASIDRALDEKLLPLGKRLWTWLGNWTGQIPVNGGLEWRFPVTRDAETNRIAAIFTDVPWEILADSGGLLAKQQNSQFAVIRRLLVEADIPPLSEYHLSILFMASSPRDQEELDYRAEEVAIEQATGERGLSLTVEESGELAQLGRTLADTRARLQSVEVLHLSCHGTSNPEPMLAMEKETGNTDLVTAYQLWEQVGDRSLGLGFISACHTGHGAEQEPAANYAMQLVRAGLPAALAWGGAVLDPWATAFAATFYQHLSQGLAIDDAYLRAHNALAKDPDCKDWHLPRLVLAQNAGTALCTGSEESRRDINPQAFAERSFLGGNRLVEIARFDEFVGRRRELQHAIRALRDQRGVLLHGPGNLGKSSLAGRLARRFPDHHHVVVHSSEFTAERVLRAIVDRCQCQPVTEAVEKTDTGNLRDGLRKILQTAENHSKPVLLFLDDFEQQLKDPETDSGLHQVQDRYRATVAQILATFGAHGGRSWLVITSRYDFELAENSNDFTAFIERIQLEPFSRQDHERQIWRLRQVRRESSEAPDSYRRELQAKAIALASGNPGLLRKLVDYINTNIEDVPELLRQVEAYLAGGRKPTDSEVGDYLERLTIGAMLDALTEVESQLLSVSHDLELPVPVSVMETLAVKTLGASSEHAPRHCHRLLSFGLWDYHPDLADPAISACAINGLVARRVDSPDEKAMRKYAELLRPVLDAAWPAGVCPPACDVLLLKLAARVDHQETPRRRAETGLQYLLNHSRYREGFPLARAAIEASATPSYELLRTCGELAIHAGEESETGREWLKKAQQLAPEPKSADEAVFYVLLLRALGQSERTLGNLKEAESLLKQAQSVLERFGRERDRVVLLDDLADILRAREELDEALRIRTEEQLPVLERLGEMREIAITKGKIADILQSRGELDEALRIRTEEELPVYEQFEDMRSIAITKGKIADILQSRGELDKALRIRTEEELPVLERLGVMREILITLNSLFDLYLEKKETQKASESIARAFHLALQLRIPDGISVVGFKLGQLLLAVEQKDEACRVLELSKSAYEKLGDAAMAAAAEELLQRCR